MSYTQENESRKRAREDDETYQPNKKITLDKTTIDEDKNKVLQQLSEIGKQLLSISKKDKETEEEMRSKFEEIKTQFDTAFNSALENAITTLNLSEQTTQIEEAERMMTEEDKLQRAREARNIFLTRMKNITDRMTTELTVDEQTKLFEYIEKQMKTKLEHEYEIRQAKEPNQLSRLAEVSSIVVSYALEQFSIVVTNVYNKGPEISTQIIAILTATAMIYNYLPINIRGEFTKIAYLGPLFEMMNVINPDILVVQNSIATVTTIFYLLRNAGMDQTETIRALGSMAIEVTALCIKTTGRFICNTSNIAIDNLQQIGTKLQTASINVLSNISNRLGHLLTQEYHEQETFLEDSQPSFNSLNNKMGSTKDPSINTSAASQKSIESVASMLDTPVTEGGIDLAGTAIPSTIVDDRFNIIASQIELAESSMPVAEVELYFDSQETAHSSISELSNDSSRMFAPWFWSRGGKRMKRSRRNMKLKKTKNRRKGRKNRLTKKGRKHCKTLKRYKFKMRY